jgi:mRNA-degrading endonuclease RelE of RelBE toxin-antitoxin system
MPNSPSLKIQVEYTSEFKRNIRQLSKKYRHIKSDVQPIINALESGETPGKIIRGIRHNVFKVRAKSTDIHKGKRSGFRLIYYLKTRSNVILLTIYSKSEQGDISAERISVIINRND